MIPAGWSAPLWSYPWQVALHSSVMGLIFYLWVHGADLPSGRTRRRLLSLLLVLPMITAAVPGRSSIDFAERLAWLNSARILAVPLLGGLHVYHVVLAGAVMMTAVTIWQELSVLKWPRATDADVPEALARLVRERPGWEQCAIAISPAESILVATSAIPGRRRVIVSRGALESLSEVELDAVIAHEYAHWRDRRWLWIHGLFLVRLLQCYNPVALWAFREYCIEVEVDCDAAAAAGRDPRTVARILLRMYQSTDRRDTAARAALRKRVDVLLGGGPHDAALPDGTVAAAAVILVLALPWIV